MRTPTVPVALPLQPHYMPHTQVFWYSVVRNTDLAKKADLMASMRNDGNPDKKAAQTIDRALDLLRSVAVAGAAGASLSELIRASRLTKPTARRLLLSLIENGLVEQKGEDRRYYVGAETYALGMMASSRFGIERLAVESLRRLAKDSGDAALLSVQRGYQTVCLGREDGDFPLRSHVLQPGDRYPLGVGAHGLAILATLSDEEVERALSVNRTVLSERFPDLPPDLLRREVKLIRDRGYAVNAGLVVKGSWAVAVALQDPRTGVRAALTIAGIESRFQDGRVDLLAAMLQKESLALAATLSEVNSGRSHPGNGS
jgi:DNA-binding IclR family transcriptional regulator